MTRRLRLAGTQSDFGIIGDVLDMTYENGEPLQVGDVVELFGANGHSRGECFVAKPSDGSGVMGVMYENFQNGRTGDWRIRLVRKFYDVHVGENIGGILVYETNGTTHTITIDGKDIPLSHESYQALKSSLHKSSFRDRPGIATPGRDGKGEDIMKGTGIFVTEEELESLKTQIKTSGMFLSRGIPIGNPEQYVFALTKKYNPPSGSGLNTETGEFVLP